MRINNLLICLAVVSLCAGCQSGLNKGKAPPTREPPVPVAGTDLDPANVEKVRVSETLKAYPVGRFVDPNDPNVMHESHVVYRKEAGAGWNLSPNAPTVVPLGPTLAVADPARQPNPLPAELEQKIAEQNQLMASLVEQNEALAAELGKLGKELADMRGRAASGETKGGK